MSQLAPVLIHVVVFFADGISSHVGDLYVHRRLGLVCREVGMIRTGVCIGILYRSGSGKDRDFDETSVLFCFDQKSESPENVSISVDSAVPVFFKGIFRSATTNSLANKELFSVHEQLVLSYFGCDFGIKEDEENLAIKDGTIKSKEERREWMRKRIVAYRLLGLQEETKQTTSERIKALFEADKARREKDPELEKERMRREKAVINARNRIREFIRIDLERRKIKEGNKIEKNEIIIEDVIVEDEGEEEEKVFERNSKEDYFKGFDAFKENLSSEFKARLKKGKVEKNEIIIEDEKKEEDKKEDEKIGQSEITFGNKSLAESIYNNKSNEKSEKSGGDSVKSDDEDRESDDRDSVSKLTLGSDFD